MKIGEMQWLGRYRGETLNDRKKETSNRASDARHDSDGRRLHGQHELIQGGDGLAKRMLLI